VELHGDKVAGMAVHIGARVADVANAGATLVSSTVKDLVSGSGLRFEDRGAHALKGYPASGDCTRRADKRLAAFRTWWGVLPK
jgi:class 3 adenylate cyclase